ncbi:hypothetical protein P872_15030 [Rhodonellum psychrophilum GCM71 = DSM 17998]|uniref:Uncharacterized protein n=2 Tax=Rhodonellum TaxID=336827 RepID=U5C614_9BACT|nr:MULTISPECIES: hypothetical protein [Rhodonellum]ERM84356.1 hypothetical protein P872_15030 [Rhodonellum psychrophilum GCM71 = DSM 17998]MDO9551839.1 hypothetical protein [Rhodonellum sp.]SDZ42758.1 hypothetical protein SAMN05444412_11436 [Rhodonellum ikkaensis]
MNTATNSIELNEFDLLFEERYSKVFVNHSKKIIICELLTDYVPIEDFKNTFLQISEVVKKGDFDKFIFDKRSLRAFHQPSMEWYFLHWKNEMLKYGIVKHRKILPTEKWFEKMVMIAKEQIMKNNPDNIIDQLDIQYCDSIEEAIVK